LGKEIGMSRVALVYPYFRTKSPTELLFPPLGAAALSSQLHARGIGGRVFDCTFSSFEKTIRALAAYAPEVVGIHSMVTTSKAAFRIAQAVRDRIKGCLLVAGGPLPTLYPERYARHFDMVFRGEADTSFPTFCQELFTILPSPALFARLPLTLYDGLYINRNGIHVNNPVVHHSESQIRSFPLPDRTDFDHSAYQRTWFERHGVKTTSLITTLGCPFSCDFCSKPVFGNVFRKRDLDSVFEEIRQVRFLDYDSLWIADDNFTLDTGFLKEFCLRMMGLPIRWSCQSRVTGIDKNMALLMKAAGCSKVYLGLETGTDAVLRIMKKQATVSDGANAVRVFHDAGIAVAAFFIVGYPGEDVASIEQTFRYALELPLDDVSFNVPFPLPGSRLFDRVSGLDNGKDWAVENEVTFVYKSEFDPQWLESRISQTMAAVAARRKRFARREVQPA
jgi:anaerobic magnesium-protoporphyrin IX monomethyl ester cyclase